jgi:tetratricopeptide (TPR) repeat protein
LERALAEPQVALSDVERGTESSGGSALNLWWTGMVLHHLHRYEEALAMFGRAVELVPEEARNWCGEGESLYHLGRYEESLAALERASDRPPARQ